MGSNYKVHSFEKMDKRWNIDQIMYTLPERKGPDFVSYAYSSLNQSQFMLFTDVKVWINLHTKIAEIVISSEQELENFMFFIQSLKSHTLQTIVDHHTHFLPFHHCYRKSDLIRIFDTNWAKVYLRCSVDPNHLRIRDWLGREQTKQQMRHREISYHQGSCLILLSGLHLRDNAIELDWELHQLKTRKQLSNLPWLLDQSEEYTSNENKQNQQIVEHVKTLKRRCSI